MTTGLTSTEETSNITITEGKISTSPGMSNQPHRRQRCCTSADEYKCLCAFSSLHAGSDSQTWLPGIPRLLEGSEPETKPLDPILLGLEHSASVLSMGGVSSPLRRGGGSRGLHSPCSPLTQSGPLQHTGKKHTTLPPRHNTQCLTTAELCNLAELTARFNSATVWLLVTQDRLYS